MSAEVKTNETFEHHALVFGVGMAESILSASMATHGMTSVNIEEGLNYSAAFLTLSIKELEKMIKN